MFPGKANILPLVRETNWTQIEFVKEHLTKNGAGSWRRRDSVFTYYLHAIDSRLAGNRFVVSTTIKWSQLGTPSPHNIIYGKSEKCFPCQYCKKVNSEAERNFRFVAITENSYIGKNIQHTWKTLYIYIAAPPTSSNNQSSDIISLSLTYTTQNGCKI